MKSIALTVVWPESNVAIKKNKWAEELEGKEVGKIQGAKLESNVEVKKVSPRAAVRSSVFFSRALPLFFSHPNRTSGPPSSRARRSARSRAPSSSPTWR